MPKIVTAGKEWQSVAIPGEFTKDAHFEFLSSFEEIIPDQPKKAAGKEEKKNKNKKKKKPNLPYTVSEEAPQSEVQNEEKNVESGTKKKKRRKKKKGKVAGNNDEADAMLVDTPQDLGAEISIAENGGISEKTDSGKGGRKQRKRKAVKKVRFSTEEPVKKQRIENEGEIGDETAQDDAEATSSNAEHPDVDLSPWTEFYLPDEIMKSLRDLRFSTPTEIQTLVIPSAARDKLDILGAAETGSGKTLAFVIPLVCRLLERENVEDENGPKGLILAPTRELVVQIRKQLDCMLKYTTFKATSIVGGLSQQKQERLLKYGPEVIVATPGRLWALAESAAPGSYLSNWSQIQAVVVDETDRMVEKGHFEELQRILDRIKSEAPAKHQTLIFSATLTFVHLPPKRLDAAQKATMTSIDKIKNLIASMGLRKEHKVFDITKPLGTPEALLETRMNCANLTEKDANVVYLLTRYPGRTLIFTNSIDASRRLNGVLRKLLPDRNLMMLHAKMIQKKRLKNLEKFADGAQSIMLATDVAARGLDIPGVQHVIHYQVSKTAESYVHRSGRTARISQKGLTVLMVDPQDIQYYSRICRNLRREKDFPVFPVDYPDLMKALKERVRAAAQVESVEHRIGKMASRETWFERAAKEADILDEREEEKELTNSELTELRRQKNAAESRLKGLMAQELPNFERQQILKTRYITPEMVTNYNKETTKDALASFEEYSVQQEDLKKKMPHLLTTRVLTKINDKKKRKKLKRK